MGLSQAFRRGHKDVEIRIVTLAPGKIPEGFRRTQLVLYVRLAGELVPLVVYEGRLHSTGHGEAEVDLCYLLQYPADLRMEADTLDHAILLSQGVVELARKLPGFRPDVIASHDWLAGLVAAYRDELCGNDPSVRWTAVVHTIHNMMGHAFQGAFADAHLSASRAGLTGLVVPGVTRSVEHFGYFNCTKAALGFSEVCNTVSVNHARELCRPAFAGGSRA